MTDPARPLGIVDGMDATPSPRVLDLLREDLQREAEDDTVLLDVPERPGYSVRYGAKVPYERYAAWTKHAEDRSILGGVNLHRMGRVVLANCCRGILRQGEELVLDGKPLTFTSPALWEMLGASDAVSAVDAFYRRDAHVIASSIEVISQAGYGDRINEADADPTGG